MDEKRMTNKQIRFVDEYLIDLNATQAAIRAGYCKNYAHTHASKLLQNATIKALLDQRMAEKKADLIAKQDEVLEYLTAVIRGISRSTEIVVEGIGDGRSEAKLILKEPSEKDRLKAAELLGKRYGLYTDKIQADVAIPVVITGGEDLAE